MARILKLVAWKILEASARRRAAANRCSDDDVAQLGGSGTAIVATLESCLPDTITESNMDIVEACTILVFTPENITERCQKCALSFLEESELNLKLCVVKCSGSSKTSNPCLKCKADVSSSWEAGCFPSLDPKQRADSEDDKGVEFVMANWNLLVLLLISVYQRLI